MDQAVQSGTSDPPDTDPKLSTLPPSQSQETIEPIPIVAQKQSESKRDHKHDSTPPPTRNPGGSDDDVQFVFAAPRRRRRKRKRAESSQNTAEHGQDTKAQAEDPLITSTPAESLRRGTTGMVQRLSSCHIGDVGNKSGPRTGSLPSVSLPVDTDSTQKPSDPLFNNKLSPRLLPFSPFMSMPWWLDPSLQLQNNCNLQGGEVSVQQGGTNKRKYSEDPEPPRPPLATRSRVSQSSSQPSDSSRIDGMNMRSLDIHNTSPRNSDSASSTERHCSIPPLQNFSWNPITNTNQTRNPTQIPTPASVPMNSGGPQQLWPRFKPSHQVSPHNCNPMWSMGPNQKEARKQQTVRLPAAFVPDQSVSPRTQTVELPKPSNPLQAQALARQMLAQRYMLQSWKPGQPPKLPIPPNSQSQIPRSMAGDHQQSVPEPQQQTPPPNRPQNAQASPFDIHRKPSLYTIPPWPCPSPPPSSQAAHLNTTGHSNSNMWNVALTSGSGMNSSSSAHASNKMNTYPTIPRSPQYVSPYQRPMQVTPPRKPSLQSQARSSHPPPPPPPSSSSSSSPPSSLPPAELQQNLGNGKRKHTPNLIVDVAETCQQNFPFAAVAERHSVPIQKVFDTFSAVIQLPLLRCASDNRRHGELAKQRMKEYKDARKAMEKAEKEKPKSGMGDAGHGSGRGRKKGKDKEKEKGLLRAAILNNARENSGLGS